MRENERKREREREREKEARRNTPVEKGASPWNLLHAPLRHTPTHCTRCRRHVVACIRPNFAARKRERDGRDRQTEREREKEKVRICMLCEKERERKKRVVDAYKRYIDASKAIEKDSCGSWTRVGERYGFLRCGTE